MADYISRSVSTYGINLAPANKKVEEYTLDMAYEAMNTVEDNMDDCMDWIEFGIGGPA